MENLDVKTDGAAPSAVAEQSNVAVLTSEQKAAWNGGKEIKPEPQDSAPADKPKEAKPEGQPESAAEAGAAKESTQEKGSKRKLSADERIAQLEATIEKIRKESGKQAPAVKEAESATAKPEAKVEQPKALEPPKKPELKDFDSWEKYEEAKDKYHEEMADFKAQQAVLKALQQRQMQERQQEFNKHLAAASEKYPNLKEVLPPITKELESANPYVQHVLNTTPDSLLPEVLMVICGEEATREAFLKEAKAQDPTAAVERIVITKKLIQEELSKGKDATAKEPKEEKKPPAEPVTRAPKPVSEVGGRGTATEDSGVAAARSGDFRTAKAEWNREFLATHK